MAYPSDLTDEHWEILETVDNKRLSLKRRLLCMGMEQWANIYVRLLLILVQGDLFYLNLKHWNVSSTKQQRFPIPTVLNNYRGNASWPKLLF
jgi:hypothetical protein